jgi:hypothetical protein
MANDHYRFNGYLAVMQRHRCRLCVYPHYYTTDLSSIVQKAFSLGDFGDRD